MGYETELQLLNSTLSSNFLADMIRIPFTKSILFIEPKGLIGIPDILVVNNFSKQENESFSFDSFAFELKLKNWRRALIQAYKNKSFASMSYVLLDEKYIKNALKNIDLFMNSNVGLISLNQELQATIHFEPKYEEPYSTDLYEKFRSKINLATNGSENSATHFPFGMIKCAQVSVVFNN